MTSTRGNRSDDDAITLSRALQAAALGVRAGAADLAGWVRGMPGHRFGNFGRGVGLRLIAAGEIRRGGALLLTPVNSVRYWEFDFADRHLPRVGDVALDVSSPRILSMYFAHRARFARISVINPDRQDVHETERIARICGFGRIVTIEGDAASLDADPGRYAAAWSISVIEHIDGDRGDTDAVMAMFRALKPGGTLVLTFPVDREYRLEHRAADVYGLGRAATDDGSYFFQRWYDMKAIQSRIIDPLGIEPISLEWFGEIHPGAFRSYEQGWLQRGHHVTVSDPNFISTQFRRYDRWEELPGMGVCGLAFQVPSQSEIAEPEGEQADA